MFTENHGNKSFIRIQFVVHEIDGAILNSFSNQIKVIENLSRHSIIGFVIVKAIMTSMKYYQSLI